MNPFPAQALQLHAETLPGRSIYYPVLCLLLLLFANANAFENPWEDFTYPVMDESRSIGSYSAGCLAGATSLTPDGEGYQVIRLGRGRYYGHPDLIDFLKDFSAKMHQKEKTMVLIGDLSMARGGPFSYGHKSHQSGLDADIWFYQDERAKQRSLTLNERDTLIPTPLADANRHVLLEENWQPLYAAMIETAATDERVERIFVHPTIKKKLCSVYPDDPDWLNKVRPWYGHNFHFHVRLKCPAGSADCTNQNAIPKTSCKDSVAWWFSKDFYDQLGKPKAKPDKPVLPVLPEACEQIRLIK